MEKGLKISDSACHGQNNCSHFIMNFEDGAKGGENDLKSARTAKSILDFIDAVLGRLNIFNQGINYQREEVRDTLRSVIKEKKCGSPDLVDRQGEAGER